MSDVREKKSETMDVGAARTGTEPETNNAISGEVVADPEATESVVANADDFNTEATTPPGDTDGETTSAADGKSDGDPSGQEIVIGVSGNAILVGESVEDPLPNSDPVEFVHQPIPSRPPFQCREILPKWLRRTSPRMKILFGIATLLLLAFIGIIVVGAIDLNSGDGNGSGEEIGDVSSAQADGAQNTKDTSPPSLSPSENPQTPSPTNVLSNISISKSQIKIAFPGSLEKLVPNFRNGLNDKERENWAKLVPVLQVTIATSLRDYLPSGYSLGPVDIEKFDGFETPRNVRQRRHLANDEGGVHDVLYSSTVEVKCSLTSCSDVPSTVFQAVNNVSDLNFVNAVFESGDFTNAPTEVPTPKPSPAPSYAPSDATSEANTSAPSKEPTATPTSTPTSTPIASPTSTPTLIPIATPTKAPTTNPTITVQTEEPTEMPTTFSPVPFLGNAGYNCGPNIPCGLCMGDCDEDEDCDTGLSCFRRQYLEFVPGCIGQGNAGQDYCYNPLSYGVDPDFFLPIVGEGDDCDTNRLCEKCRGDCDDDDECAWGLVCFKRSKREHIPGCGGQGTSGADYCFDPSDIWYNRGSNRDNT